MTTLILDDVLAERLTHIAATQGKNLHTFASEALQQLAETTLPDATLPDSEPDETSLTLADEVMPVLKRIWAAQKTAPAEPYLAPGTFGDIYEERLSQMWDTDHAPLQESQS